MIRFLTLSASLFLAAPHLSAETLRLSAPSSSDLVPSGITAAKIAAVERHSERELVQFSWPIEESATIDLTPQPFLAESREFWTTLEGSELAKGVAFTTTAPGALIRLSPAEPGKRAGLDLSGMRIEIAGRSYTREQAVAVLADAGALKQAGAEFPEGTVAFRVRSELGAGPTRLILPKASGRVLLHVFEPDSSLVLRLEAEPFVGADGRLRIAGGWAGLPKNARPIALTGLITAPDGYTQNFELERRGEDFAAEIALERGRGYGEGLWEVHLFAAAASAAGDLRRDVRTAFAVSQPSARLDGRVESHEEKGALVFTLGVENALAARYELRAVLTGTAEDGSERPLAVTHAAVWLEPGRGAIPLRIEKEHLARPGIGAPYALRDLRLIRQGDQNLQERRDRPLHWR